MGVDRDENARTSEIEPSTDRSDVERLAAHERLSTGALSSWMRACASHPWRVVLAWLGIIVVLIFLVATVGGSLKDEFEIPGLRHAAGDGPHRSRVRLGAGCSPEPRLRRSRGRAPGHAGAKGGSRGRDRGAEDVRVQAAPRTRRESRASAIRSAPTRSPTTGASRTPRHSSRRPSRPRTATRSSPSRTRSGRRSSRRA